MYGVDLASSTSIKLTVNMGNRTNYKKNIAIVIPAYDEGSVVGNVIKELDKALRAKQLSFEIIVVDDGSRDDTAQVAENAGAHVIKHILNTGKAARQLRV